MLAIRPASPHVNDGDLAAIWSILEPVIRAGDTLCLPIDMSRAAALAFWFAPSHAVFVAEEAGLIIGSYFLRANQLGGGSHVANCGYMTASATTGRGVGRAMCLHSLDEARRRGFRSMQFNIVVSTNQRAVRLWQTCGFRIIAQLPQAFHHPTAGLVDAYVMHCKL